MRRILISLFLIALTAGSVAAQEEEEAGRFRFASDPFGPEVAKQPTENAPTSDRVQTSAAEEAASFSTYEPQDGYSLVHKKAMFKGEQRQLILATRQWYGYSKSRPAVYGNPYMNGYYPTIVGRFWSPYRTWH